MYVPGARMWYSELCACFILMKIKFKKNTSKVKTNSMEGIKSSLSAAIKIILNANTLFY